MKLLLVCDCSGKLEKSKIAYGIIKPGDMVPSICKGKEEIAKLASKYNNDHLRAISKLNGNFSFYIDIDENGKIVEEYDLTTGRKLA